MRGFFRAHFVNYMIYDPFWIRSYSVVLTCWLHQIAPLKVLKQIWWGVYRTLSQELSSHLKLWGFTLKLWGFTLSSWASPTIIGCFPCMSGLWLCPWHTDAPHPNLWFWRFSHNSRRAPITSVLTPSVLVSPTTWNDYRTLGFAFRYPGASHRYVFFIRFISPFYISFLLSL